MRSAQATVAVLLLIATVLGCTMPRSDAARVMGYEKNLKSLLPGCSPPPAPVDTPYTPSTPTTSTPVYTPTTPATPSDSSPVYTPPTVSYPPPAGGY
ncbi:uncharacterized protein [Physcomitrium patens]|uniref:Uncharacterized protein n=1 Tax=Physcomitrium patens TaxID=3218 RepID=A0A2K1K6H4_PHYPA|nr:leucine-rich repeat extensin-like protein 3 [Physcomitrium patens]PNR49372.1 hypothetical protein PHYPA_011268 [Physcomitrium patens]|eukprot:XP_024382830.1 leucine-rich repeat extensin-like protein 3 [Physcomitrella patens]